MQSKIENLEGNIQIDNPSNKSGLDTSYHEFPTFKSNTKTYVYYDDPSIQNGLYNRENFKFIVYIDVLMFLLL